MKKGKYLVLIVAMFIVMMSGCKKKEKTVADDFNDIEGTTMASTDSDADKEQETSEANEADSKSELSVDATVHFDDKAVDIHYDVRAWSADIAGPVPATKKTIDQAYIEALCDRVFDEGQYEDIPSGGDLPEGDVYCNVMGDIDGAVSTLEYSDYYDGWSNTVYIRNQVANWMDMTPDMLAVAEPNALNFDDAMKTAEDYLERWGYENFYCVAYDEITSDFGESALPDGYDIKFQKKIGNSLGVPYTCNCVYDMEHPFPSYMEEINIVISSDGLLHASITDMYEAGTEQQTATIMDVNDMYEKATATIEEYFSGDRYSEEYLESILGDESVWNIYVDLLYVPIAMGDEISYRALYVFSFDLDGLSSKVPLVAFDAYDGTRYNIEMKKGMTITQTELTWREDKTITTIPWAEITDAHLERVKTSWIRPRTIKIALKITHQRKGESEPRHESFDLRGIGINNEEEFIKKNTELLGRNPFSETITKYWVLPF